MSRIKIISAVAVGLFVINLMLIGFILNKRAHRPGKGEGPQVQIVQILHLDEMQQARYKLMVEEHKALLQQNKAEMLTLKKELLATLGTETDGVKKDSLIVVLGAKHADLERGFYDHFLAIKKLCKPDQQAFFQQLALELPRMFDHHQGPPPRR